MHQAMCRFVFLKGLTMADSNYILTPEGRRAAAEYAACFGPLCRRMQQALGLEEDACQTAVCAILAQSQDRLPQLRDRLLSAEQ